MPFQRKRDGIHLALADHERALVGDLTRQLVELLDEGDSQDPALARLIPDGYSGDDDEMRSAAAEFRRLTADDLTAAKARNAERVIETLVQDRRQPLGLESEQAWLRTLTDLRLTLASRLGVTADGYEAQTGDPQTLLMRDIYEWLGYVQESLVRALDR
ncbi:DUF2017 family protein [Frondihabitans australicus]|uniref:Uncharacterized protein DUF2017 n=1 Tax=Frondihabitans australicus TaxID=386892 RepID=A0A495II83_9MICO|nr:DUF2017 family protein [Frondihabitans australicus]RKR75410.1 uncharacterized protein DUF2017 [Frondihabitans australicus]